MSIRTILLRIVVTAILLLSAGCGEDTPSIAVEEIDVVRVIVTERTGSIESHAFHPLDPALFEQLQDLGPQAYDFSTEGCEYYDIYFSTQHGTPLPIEPQDHLTEPIFITINCVDLDCANGEPVNAPAWDSAGCNLDAVAVTTLNGTLFVRDVLRVRYGGCDEPLSLNPEPGDRILGPPDGIVTSLGGGYSTITARMDFITLGTLTLFEESNSPSRITLYHFPNLDYRLFEKIPALSQECHDLATGDCELYDIYFSTAEGTPIDFGDRLDLPDPVHVTIDCLDLNCDTELPDEPALWSEADGKLDAVRLSFYGWHRFARQITRVQYGTCGEPPGVNQWTAEEMSGPPDSSTTRTGGGFSSVTVQLADTTL